MDEEGNEVWNKTYGEDDMDEAKSIIEIEDGYVIAGDTFSYGNAVQAFVIKIDKEGNVIWMKNYGGHNWEMAQDIAETEDGYIIAGSADAEGFSSNAWLLKIDKEGNELWNKTFGNRKEDTARSIVIDNAYIVGGSTNENDNRQGMLIKCYDDAYEPSIKIIRPKKNYLYT